MKVCLALLLLVALGASQPQRYAFQRAEEAPYPAAGYRPAGAEFRLPERQQVPRTVYGPPQEYGPPEEATTESEGTTTEQPVTTTGIPSRRAQVQEMKGEEAKEDEAIERGVYYIYHPSGLLQRITYTTKNDVENMGYTAQLKYEDVQPIKDPVYTYDPDTLVLQQIQL